MKHPNAHEEQGYIVLITVLILGVVVTTTALFLLITGTNTTIASSAAEARAQAQAGTLACGELALARIKADPTLTTPASDSVTIDAILQQECSYTITGNSPDYTITVNGVVRQSTDNYIQRLTITTSQTTPQVVVSGWQDTP